MVKTALQRQWLHLFVGALTLWALWLAALCPVIAATTTTTTRLQGTSQLAAFGIDLGSENVRFAASQALTGIQVLTNEQSKRETPALIAFVPVTERLLERRFGESGMSPAYGRWPDYAVRGVRTLFEQTNCSGQGALVASSRSQRERLVHRCIVQLGRRQELVFTDIELVGMLLGQVRRRAYAAMRATLSPEEEEQLSSTPNEHLFGSDAVLTVPVWFRQSQRAALVKAARLAGWNVRGLVHTPLAAAIRFALDRAINGTQTVLFVDVGAQGTTTALIRFTTSNKMTKESSTAAGNVPLPVQAIEVLEYAWDDRVGGRAFDHCLSDLVLDRLRERSLLTAAVTADAERRFQLRLERESNRVREVLSANQEALFHIELPDGTEHHLLISRAEFETRCSGLFEQIQLCVQRLLSSHQRSANKTVLDALIPLGGGSRMPRVEQEIQRIAGSHLWQKTVNAEEAAVMGAAFYAAALSPLFRVRQIGIYDVHPRGFMVCAASGAADRQPHDHCEELSARMARFDGSRRIKFLNVSANTELHLYEGGDTTDFWTNASRVAHWEFEGWPEGHESPMDLEVRFGMDALGEVELASAQIQWNSTVKTDIWGAGEGVRRDQRLDHAPGGTSETDPNRSLQERSVETNATEETIAPSTFTRKEPASASNRAKTRKLRPSRKSSVWDQSEANRRESGFYLATLDAQDLERERRAHLLNALEAMLLRAHEDFGASDASGTSGALARRLCWESEREKILKQVHQAELWMHQRPSTELDVAGLEQRLQELERITNPVYHRVETYQKGMKTLQQLEHWILQHRHEPKQPHPLRAESKGSSDLDTLLEQVRALSERFKAHPSAALVDQTEQELQSLSERFASALLSMNQTHAERSSERSHEERFTPGPTETLASVSISTVPKQHMDHTEL